MPIYEYQCEECQSVFEDWQSGFEDREMECPDCGGASRRLISHTSFHLKGGGWYADGYGGPQSGSQSGTEAASDGAADSGGAESAPAKQKESPDTSSADSAS